MKTKSRRLFIVLALLMLSSLRSPFSTAFAQGSLTPPGAPAPTMKTLDQIEPRTPISSLPLTITNGGSFYLTTNVFAGASQNGITIQADNVTLDLNGFTMANAVFNNGTGINVANAQRNLVVRNGTLRNWNTAVDARIATGCTYSDLRILTNSFGLETGTNAQVKNCIAANNGNDGIAIQDGSMVTECKTFSNGRFGLAVTSSALISATSVTGNTLSGVSITGTNNVMRDCLVSVNGVTGIVSGGKNRFIACTVTSNGSRGIDESSGAGDWVEGCTISGNVNQGIFSTGHGAVLLNNTVSSNASTGITLSGDSGVIDGNIIMFNSGSGLQVGAASGTNNVIIRNRAIGQSVNYTISVPSKDAQRLTPGSNFTTTDPWANLSF